ncbi:hypothetical protein [Pandoraea norimbergensis]|uniref:DUF2917 domain-containing protein n=1 Tax=Pandoraea norimbergensis TaxID=93219 RepID=A0ABN4JDU1_9BURK|nr:hypothetical protein [Pandoraea norimbergensis]ALS58937.1 hypothetical protein AT302_03230 [Pandoraea norimbergensis]
MAKRPQTLQPLFSSDLALTQGRRDSRAAATNTPNTAGDLVALPEQLTLARAQAFHTYVRRGAVFHVKRGSVALTPAPRWLAATVWAAPVQLTAGHAYVVQETGWLVLSTGQGAELTCHDGDASPERGLTMPWRVLRARFGF